MFRRALALVKLNKSDAALDQFTELLTRYPENKFMAEARYYRGLLFMLRQKPDEGLADLQTAVDSPALSDPLKINARRLASVRLREKKGNDQAAAAMLQRLEKSGWFAGDEAG